MSYQKIVIKNFEKALSDNANEIIKIFIKEGEFQGAFGNLDDRKDELIEKFKLVEQVLKEQDLSASAKTFESLKQDCPTSVWIKKVDERLQELVTAKKSEGAESIHLDELTEEAVRESNIQGISTEEYMIFRNNDQFKTENEKFISEVNNLATGYYVYSQGLAFIDKLKNSTFGNALYVYRSISVSNAAEYLEKFTNGSLKQDRPMGGAWSRSVSKAISYNAESSSENIKFHGNIAPEGIDYITTIVKNISLTYSHESEFVLIPDSEVSVYKVEICDKEYNILSTEEFEPPITKKI